jgi:hypothetical protein
MASSSEPIGCNADTHREEATAVEPQPLARPKEEPKDLAEPEVPVKVIQLNKY